MSALLLQNLKRRIKDATVYLTLASQPGISNTAKSAYYRACILVTASIVEGLLFFLISKLSSDNNPVIHSEHSHKNLHRLPSRIFNRSDVIVGNEVTKEIRLRDKQCTFNLMIQYCKNNRILTERECKRVEYVRIKRNQLHVQGLNSKDRGYDIRTVKLISEAVGILTLIIDNKIFTPSRQNPS